MKRLLALMLAGAMMLCAAGAMAAVAQDNHWGASDVRLYLNNGARVGSVWQVDSTAGSDNKSDYAAHFSDEEFARILPTTVETVVDGVSYWTRDRFYLPSGNHDSSKNKILSQGERDISVDDTYNAVALTDVIPISYWAETATDPAWLRSAHDEEDGALTSKRGYYVQNDSVDESNMIAPLFRVSLKNVTFASRASAAKLQNGAQKIAIAGSDKYGKPTEDSLPEYGMYLKTRLSSSFSVQSVSYQDLNRGLEIKYTGGNTPGHAVVVCAYGDDNLKSGTTAYCAAASVRSENGSVCIDVSRWGLNSLAGMTIQVWMEETGTASLAKATKPETFMGMSDFEIVPTTKEAHNPRVFAMKDELACSWDELATVDAPSDSNPSNQKIYYGTYTDTNSNNKPMEFWIAGIENNIMTLYQAKTVESQAFKMDLNKKVMNPEDTKRPDVKDPDVSDDPIDNGGGGTKPDEEEVGSAGGVAESEPEPEMKPELELGEAGMPQTGDASMLGAWVCLLGAAGATLKLRRKR